MLFSTVRRALIPLSLTLGAAVQAQTITTTGFADSNPFAVSNTDLLQTHLGSYTYTGSTYNEFHGPTSNIFDGTFGNAGLDGNASVSLVSGSLTLNLDLIASPTGYNLTSISTYAGWVDNGRSGQAYTVFYSVASDPSTFLPLANVSQFNVGGSGDIRTEVVIAGSGLLAANVASLRFDFTSYQNAGTSYREIDVEGASSAVPEPSLTALLFGAAAGAAALRRYKRCAA